MTEQVLSHRRVVLGVTGSIAAYKACELVRRLKDAGAEVKVVMTANARRFVSEATLECLSCNKVLTDTFARPPECVPEHISLSQWADILLVAPATANIIGKAAAGIGDDLLSTTILSAVAKVVFAPAMNSSMYANAVVQDNIAKLRQIGCEFVGPQAGFLACGEEAVGRLADINLILEKIEGLLKEAS